jgi:hypothetical protein
MLGDDRRPLTYCGQKMVLTLGSTFIHLAKRLVVRLGVGLFTDRAAKPAKAVAVRAEALTPHVAFRASHCDLGFCFALGFALHDYIISYR